MKNFEILALLCCHYFNGYSVFQFTGLSAETKNPQCRCAPVELLPGPSPGKSLIQIYDRSVQLLTSCDIGDGINLAILSRVRAYEK